MLKFFYITIYPHFNISPAFLLYKNRQPSYPFLLKSDKRAVYDFLSHYDFIRIQSLQLVFWLIHNRLS